MESNQELRYDTHKTNFVLRYFYLGTWSWGFCPGMTSAMIRRQYLAVDGFNYG